MRKQINVKREYRRGNQKWTIQRNWQHLVYNTQEEDKKKQEQNHDYSEKMKKKNLIFLEEQTGLIQKSHAIIYESPTNG